MLENNTIRERLERMRNTPDPGILWDETCEGSGCALVVFVGPSPGGTKVEQRHPLRRDFNKAYWDQPYDAPVKLWGPGFRKSFSPLVAALFDLPFAKAAKLVGRANMDWLPNPESEDVPARFMWEGRNSVLRMIEIAQPQLVVAWDRKTCMILEIALHDAGFTLDSVRVLPEEFTVRISNAQKSRYHYGLQAFKARSSKNHEFVVLKTPQHPARMFDAEYATRCGEALREAAKQIAEGSRVKVERL